MANVGICAFLVRVGAPLEAKVEICVVLIRSGRPLPVNVRNYRIFVLFNSQVWSAREGQTEPQIDQLKMEATHMIGVENRREITARVCKLSRFRILWNNSWKFSTGLLV